MNRRQKIIVSVTGIFIVLLVLIGLTYAYFLTQIKGNTNNKSISVTTADLKLVYSDGNGVVSLTNIMPGDPIPTKTFTVKNEGTKKVSYTIIFDNVENNFSRTQDLKYTLTNTDTSETTTGIIYRLEEQTVLANIEIETGVTDNYTLKIEYPWLDNEDQSIDMAKSLSLRVNIRDVSNWDKAEEGTLLHAIKRDNQVVDPVTLPGKIASGNIYKQTISEIYRIPLTFGGLDYINAYWVYGTGFKFNNSTGTYTLTGINIVTYEELLAENSSGKDIYLLAPVPAMTAGDTLEAAQALKTSDLENIYLLDRIDSTNIYTYPHGNAISTTNEALLTYTEDDLGTSYYYRGSVENNYVNYKGMCWRIVRVQGDGSIKLTLADEFNECDDSATNDKNGNGTYYSKDNTNSALMNSAAKMAYKTNVSNDETDVIFENSDIPAALETWAIGKGLITEENGNKTVAEELAEAKWCNDNTISDYDEEEETTYFVPYRRLENRITATPTLKCTTTSAIYTGVLGMLTADETFFAGASLAVDGGIYSHYLLDNAGTKYYTMTPYSFISANLEDEEPARVRVMSVFPKATIGSTLLTSSTSAIRPTIVLKQNIQVTGEGTQTNPYNVN